MNIETKRRMNRAVAAVALFCTALQPTYALNLATEPLFVANRIAPKVMLTLSKDQQLFKKAYNDYSDLDGDNVPETTYKHSISYYGYFDPTKCYDYNTTDERFVPTNVFTVLVNGVNKPAPAYCDTSTGRWSGNFLNWVSMSRIDAVRKLLYGGMRQIDTATETVLERAHLPTDAHAWAKYYNGSDIAKLTPFAPPTAPASVDLLSTPVRIGAGNQDLVFPFVGVPANFIPVGSQLKIAVRGKPNEYVLGAVTAATTSLLTLNVTVRINRAGIFYPDAGTNKDEILWTVTNLSATGISFCNLTKTEGAGSKSHTNANPPIIRVAQGNFALWNANEVFQCRWSGERSNEQLGFGGVRSNGNLSALSEIDASAENPSQTIHGLGRSGAVQGEYNARVKVCDTNVAVGTENCRAYSSSMKPVGLLQRYEDTIHFGLMTGSYTKNISGGVLRKAVGAFTDEVNATNGTFTAVKGIVASVNALRIYGYDYTSGTYIGAAADNCTYQLTDLTENQCTSWGNPMSEIYYEAIRYFAAKTPNSATPAYTYTQAGSKDYALGLPQAAWTPPVTQETACARLNVLLFNASVSTDDEDLGNTVASDINAGNKTIRELTNAVGDLEGLRNKDVFIGKRMSDTSATSGFELCAPKTITDFGDISGICPEGPTLRGSYLLAGVAHHARTNKIRTDLSDMGDPMRLKVTSYGVQLATNTPQLEIAVPGTTNKVIIQPIYRLDLGTRFGGGSIVDMKYVRTQVSGSISTGKVYINWEDSEQGGDYDQDMWGTIEWVLDASAKTIKITTNAIAASTGNPQGFGYTVSGTTQDGPHFHSGIYGFNFTDTVTASYVDPADATKTIQVNGCVNCQVASAAAGQRGASSVSYALSSSGSTATALKDPLWYLAKYGGFDDKNKNGVLDVTATEKEWDLQNNLTGAATPDGVPDTYFLVTNPLGLEAALERAFRGISVLSSGTSVGTNAGSIRSGSAVYLASFRTGEWNGKLVAQMVESDGSISTSEEWDAANKLPPHDRRVILTYRNDGTQRKGIPFRWTDAGPELVAALNQKPDGTGADARGAERLSYLRGDPSLEGTTLNDFRIRPSANRLGDIVNSNPVFVPAVPDDVVLDKSYVDFRDGFIKQRRTPMVYVAANDGMLHGFDGSVSTVAANGTKTPSPTGGTEVFAYVPSKTFANLTQLTNPNYVHRYYVDGTPAVADAKVNGSWATVLVGTLGAGGRGVYALDVTRPPVPVQTGDSRTVEQQLAPKVLWEFNAEDDLPATGSKLGLGYSLGKPLIRKMKSAVGPDGKPVDRWAAIVSSGYNNAETVPGKGNGDGKAYIYVIFLEGPRNDQTSTSNGVKWRPGVDYIRLEADVPPNTDENGMAPPLAADVNGDGMIDYIYAGDLLGNLWKFDVTSVNPADWTDPSNRALLFKGGSSQPITATPQATVHPTGKGFILSFGTGKYLQQSDPLPPFQVQSFYGIWDKHDQKPIANQTVVPGPGSLFPWTVKEADTGPGTTVFRYLENADGKKGPDWSTHLGWFMNLPRNGERSVSNPVVVSRRLFFSTLVPSGGACDFGGTSFIMVVNPGTGGDFDSPTIDVNRDGKLDAADAVSGGHFAIGVESGVGIVSTPQIVVGGLPAGSRQSTGSTTLNNDGTGRVVGSGNRRAGLYVIGSTGKVASSSDGKTTPPVYVGRDSGRATWREMVNR